MNERETVKLFCGITDISEEIIAEAGTVRRRKKVPVWAKWGAAAACICLIAAGTLVWRHASLSAPAASGITVSEEGVTIPPMEVDLSAGSAANMIGFFIYQGRCYTNYGYLKNGAVLAGEYLGTATGLIDEWTPRDGYVELAGSVGGDFYAVKGYDPAFALCMQWEYGEVQLFLCSTGITLKTGADLYEERLHLSENYRAVQYETRTSWYYGQNEVYQLTDPKSEVITDFITALDEAEFLPVSDVPLNEGETGLVDREIWHLYFLPENGLPVHLRLSEGGYVRFDLPGLWDVCVQVPEPQFSALINLLSDPDAGTLID